MLYFQGLYRQWSVQSNPPSLSRTSNNSDNEVPVLTNLGSCVISFDRLGQFTSIYLSKLPVCWQPTIYFLGEKDKAINKRFRCSVDRPVGLVTNLCAKVCTLCQVYSQKLKKNTFNNKIAGVNLYGYRQFLDVRRPDVDKGGNILHRHILCHQSYVTLHFFQ